MKSVGDFWWDGPTSRELIKDCTSPVLDLKPRTRLTKSLSGFFIKARLTHAIEETFEKQRSKRKEIDRSSVPILLFWYKEGNISSIALVSIN